MGDLQSTLGNSLNKIQDTFQQGKSKIHTAQEVSQYKKELYEAGSKRGELLLKLGETAYQLMRSQLVEYEELDKYREPISILDRKMYQLQKVINQLNHHELEQLSCAGCGGELTNQDKFCGSCGAHVKMRNEEPLVETKLCKACEEDIPHHAQFCSCCGTSQVSVNQYVL